jgi:hypothetical protein
MIQKIDRPTRQKTPSLNQMIQTERELFRYWLMIAQKAERLRERCKR